MTVSSEQAKPHKFENNYNVCAVIPVYKHVQFVRSVYDRLREHALHCFIVNDGNNEQDSALLHSLFDGEEHVEIIDLYPNQGKGLASFAGFKAAYKQGYTHALQVDADGQHNLNDFPALLRASQHSPDSLVTGIPIYDDSVPKSRYYSRYITHFWVWVETLSFSIKDSMCGFRIYPLKTTIEQLEKRIAPRMDFDTHIMVRMYWAGVHIISVPTKVIYPEDGVSNFRLLRDNVRISGMHIRLVIGMLLRSPQLMLRKLKNT